MASSTYAEEVGQQALEQLGADVTVHDSLLGSYNRSGTDFDATWGSAPQSPPAKTRQSRFPTLCTVLFLGVAIVAAATVGLHPQRLLQSKVKAPVALQEQPFMGQCAIVEQDTDFLPGGPGPGDYPLDHIPEANLCCAMCHGIPGCLGWVWKNAGLNECPYQCWIMVNPPMQHGSVKGVVSGMPPSRPQLPPSVANSGVFGAFGGLVPAPAPAPIFDARAGCAEFGSNCWGARCCKNPNQRCFMKTPAWAGCKDGCTAGVDPTDPPEARQPWACTDVTVEPTGGGGGAVGASGSSGPPPPVAPVHLEHMEPPGPPAQFTPDVPLAQEAMQPYVFGGAPNQQGTKLFCFALIQSTGYELELLKDQKEMETSIFACETYSIYSNRAIEVSPGITTSVVADSMQCEFHEIAWNTNIFISVWYKVVNQGWYQSMDWTVKADADATFFPDRLRTLLPQHRGAGYLVNCQYGLHGPIEVLSQSAVNVLAADYAASAGGLRPEKCVQKYAQAITGNAQWGEDLFLDYCLRYLGVSAQPEYRLLCEAHCDCPNWYWCHNGTDRVSYHPFKRKDMYRQCVANALYTGA